jgi:ribose-phosphate pyrophosphokinase
MGVSNIITFDAHDPRVQNAIPLSGFETVSPSYQFVKNLLATVDDLQIDSSHMMVISPDEGGTHRAVYLANVMGLDMGMFYKRRDYTRIVNGRNPIVAHEFLGSSVEGKDVIIVDDMISSGESMLDVALQVKERHAKRVFVCTTFGLFTDGFDKFDEYYEKGYINKVITTNLTYLPAVVNEKPYFITADMSKFLALIIDSLNHDLTIGAVLNPTDKIHALLEKYLGKNVSQNE